MDWNTTVDQLPHAVLYINSENYVVKFNALAQPYLTLTCNEGAPLDVNSCLQPWLAEALFEEKELEGQRWAYGSEGAHLICVSSKDESGGRFVTISPPLLERNTAVFSKTAFLDNMSHELRTPLNAIVGHTNLLRDTHLNNEQHQLINGIVKNSSKLTTIITNLLEYTQADASSFQLIPQPFDLNELLNNIVEHYDAKIHDQPLSIHWQLAEGTPTHLKADFVRIRQLLCYLLDNAIKFSEEGTISLHVSHLTTKAIPLILKFTIEDSGDGIPSQFHGPVTHSFLQYASKFNKRSGGLGLSLAIAKKISQHMGGSLSCGNAHRGGAQFIFMVPVETSSETPQLSALPTSSVLRDKRLLIIGNNIDHRRVIGREAKLAGMYPYVARSESEMMYWLEKETFNLVCVEGQLLREEPTLLDGLKSLPDARQLGVVLLEDELDTDDVPVGVTAVLPTSFSTSALYDVFTRAIMATTPTQPLLPKTPARPVEMASYHPLAILMVEDNIINQKVATKMLNQLGYSVDHAPNGQIGVEKVSHHNYDVILMDIQMPVMDGVTATRKIRQLGSTIRQPYIVATTAHAREGDRERYLSVGMDAYLSKPVQMESLVETLYACQRSHSDDTEPSNLEDELSLSGIDYDALVNLFGDDVEEFLAEMAPIFLEDSRETLYKIKQALPLHDYATIKDAAHALKGASANMGMRQLAQLCGQLERCVIDEQFGEAELLFSEIREEHDRIIHALQNPTP